MPLLFCIYYCYCYYYCYSTIAPILFNDVWGWTCSDTGREIVITGVEEGTYFVEITAAGHPIILGFLPSISVVEKFTM